MSQVSTVLEIEQSPATDAGRVSKSKLPFKTGCRTRTDMMAHGAYSLTRKYYAGLIDRRYRLGKSITEWETELARHVGFERLYEAPITVQMKIRLAVGNMLFLMTFEPGPLNVAGGREIRASENTLNRIMTELGLKRPEKPLDLEAYIASKEDQEPE
jgi:hypothetical protein